MINRASSGKDFFGRAALWGLLGLAAGLEGGKLAACTFLGPAGEKALGFTLEDMLAAAEQERQQQLQLERQRNFWAALGQAADNMQQEVALRSTSVDGEAGASTIVSPQANFSPAPREMDGVWRQNIVHPSVVLVVGKLGSGKSALGYRLLEVFRYKAQPFVVGVPESARSLLPDWIGIAPTLEEVPVKSIALVDEAYLHYHARGSMAKESKAMSQLLNLPRQREQTIIFITQEARQVDRNIASSANVVVFKDLGMLQLEFDRPELNKLAAQARTAFATAKGDK